MAQWIFSGLNKHDNNSIELLKLKTYNCTTDNLLFQIKRQTFPKESILCGLNEKVVRSVRRKKVLTTRKAMLNMLSEVNRIDEEEEKEIVPEGVQNVNVESDEGADDWMTKVVKNEIRAIEDNLNQNKR